MDPSEELCSICLDPLNEGQDYKLNCKHRFHKKCIRIWLTSNNTCPLCRKNVDPDPKYVEEDILTETRRRYIEMLIKGGIKTLSGVMEYFIPELAGCTEVLDRALDSERGNTLLRQVCVKMMNNY